MSDHQVEEVSTVNQTPQPQEEATSTITQIPHQEEATSTVAEVQDPQDDEMSVDSVDSVSHERQVSVIARGSLDHEMETDTTSTQPVDVPSDRMSVDQKEETPAIVSTSASFDFTALFQAVSSVAESAVSNNSQRLEVEFTDDDNGFMREVLDIVTEADADQGDETNHEVENEPEVTVVEALLLSELKISTSNRFQILSILEHLVQSMAATDQCAPLLQEIEHNVDTYALVKLDKGKKVSDADGEDDAPEKIGPHAACGRCKHDPAVNEPASTLLTCGNCKAVQYCSIICQLRDWKAHKSIYCVNPINIPVDILARPHKAPFLMTTIANPFARLSKGIWLHDRHKQDVYILLIDSFRLREYDDYTFGGTSNADSVYSGRPSSCPAFRRFLYQAEAKGLMPPWWTDHKRVECLTKAIDRSADNWHDIHTMTRDVEVVVVYEAAIMAMQLRMFAETVLGSGAAGTDGRLMLQHMVVIEEEARDIAAQERAAREAEEMAEE
ncbi:hypothetical protein CCMA1212_007795 [Trichoderma ghanense]|uniref:MYND-type domain-containing protein n=1 Tax=Trichoderma ghanense TaxID=65468 RepID=A0ABY2GXS2_9HYPO